MIEIAVLRSLLDYDPETGIFHWLADPGTKRLAGKVAGTLHPNGYTRIRIAKKNYYAHRLAWLYVHGKWPEGHLDHRDGNPQNNRIANLRTATRAQNLANQKRRKDNTSGYRGVHPHQGGFYAVIQSNGKQKMSLKCATVEQAAEEYRRLSALYHGEFGRPS